MIKKLLNFTLFLCMLVLGASNAMGTEEVAYTLTPAAGSNSAYTGNCDIEIDGVTWNVTGNAQMLPWRLGGKSLTEVDRTIYSKTAIADNITSIVVTNGTASSITVNSFTLVVSTEANGGGTVVSTVTGTFAASGTTTFTRPEGADWTGRYYKFTYNVTVSGTSNKFVQFSGAVFNKEKVIEAGQTETTTTFPETAYTAYIGEDFTSPVATVSGGEGLAPTYSSDNEDVATVNATTGVVTLVKAGTAKITASFAVTDAYTASSASYTLAVGNVYTDIQALQKGTISTTSTPMKVTLTDVVVAGVKDKKAYLSDGTYGVILFSANHGLTQGQVINGTLEAASQLYNGSYEITNFSSTGLTITDGELGTPATVTISELTVANQSRYVKLEGVAYDADAKTFSDGTNAIAYYDELATNPELTDGAKYDVTGIYNFYNAGQIFPIEVEKLAEDVLSNLSFEKETYTFYNDDKNMKVTATSSNNTTGAITYALTEGDAGAFLIDENTGDIFCTTNGTYTVTATIAAVTGYTSATATTTVSISNRPETRNCALVSSYKNTNYAIACGEAHVVGTSTYKNTMDAVEVYVANNKVIDVNNIKDNITWTIEFPSETSAYIFDGTNYLYCNRTGTKTYSYNLSTSTTKPETAWYVSDGLFKYDKATERSIIFRNTNDDANYSSTQYEGFRIFATSNEGKDSYGTSVAAMTFADGYVRKLTASEEETKAGTICLDRTIEAEDLAGAKFYSIAGKRVDADNNVTSVVLEEETDGLVAGYPYIFIATGNVVAAYTGEAEATTAESNQGLIGSLEGTAVAEGKYLISGNKLVKCGTGCKIGANRAYIDMDAVAVYTETSEAKGIVEIGANGLVDFIQGVNAAANNSVIYNIAGQRVNKAQKGLYIINGKKVVK